MAYLLSATWNDDVAAPCETTAVIWFALIAGAAFGTISAGSMVKIKAPSPEAKRDAIVAAFVDRFLIGFVVGPVASGLGVNGLLVGALLGLGLSVPSALITKAYVPIIVIGTIGGLAVGIAYELVY
jgi:hypothetical protein